MIELNERIATEVLCARLCTDFVHFVDARKYDKVVAMVTEDAVLNRIGTVLRGRDEILRFMESRPLDIDTHHICANIRIDLQADGTAQGECSVLMYHRPVASNDQPSLTLARYRDVYVATPAGWKIRERLIDLPYGK